MLVGNLQRGFTVTSLLPLVIFSDCSYRSQGHCWYHDTWTLQRLQMLSNCSKMAQSYMPLPEGLQYLPAQSREHGGNSRRKAVTVEHPSVEWASAPLSKEEQQEELPEPDRRTSSRCECLWPTNQKDFMSPKSSSEPCVHCAAPWSLAAVIPEQAGPQFLITPTGPGVRLTQTQ